METPLSRLGRGSCVALVALGALAACAPTTVSPMVMRLGPGHPENTLIQAGVRSGPRLSSPLAGQLRFEFVVDALAGKRNEAAYRTVVAKIVARGSPIQDRHAPAGT